MNVKEMQYDLKTKLNKVDSQQYTNLLIPEIDWVLNRATEIFVKEVILSRRTDFVMVEASQRNIDDIRTIIKPATIFLTSNTITLPPDYWHFLDGNISFTKGTCTGLKARFYPKEHKEEYGESPYDNTSSKWRRVVGVFEGNTIICENTEGLVFNAINLEYIKKLSYIHNAEDFTGGTYTNLQGTVLTGTQDCELPAQTHSEIVDIAVLLIAKSIEGFSNNKK